MPSITFVTRFSELSEAHSNTFEAEPHSFCSAKFINEIHLKNIVLDLTLSPAVVISLKSILHLCLVILGVSFNQSYCWDRHDSIVIKLREKIIFFYFAVVFAIPICCFLQDI
jgi:hypothetical protein